MTILLIGIFGAFGVSCLIFALSLAREKGTLAERLSNLEAKAEIDRKRAEIVAGAKTDEETIASLDDGTF